jgi:predicted ATPase
MNSAAGTSMTEVRYISELKQRGQDHQLVDLLRSIDERMAGIELLAPGGDVPELFVRMERTAPLLPLASMGEGFQRCLELAAAAMVHDWPVIFVDEIENGMHHLALGPLWRWIATTALERGIQVFATTHSEECITAAHRAFDDLGDDGLRVIRLDRLEQRTQAAIYDRSLIETAERTGTEIRG